MIRFLSFSFLMTVFMACETGQLTSTPAELEGAWLFKGYDNSTTPDCREDAREVTLDITRQGNGFEISGRSFINIYSSSADVSYNPSTQSGTIKFSAIGSTKMGGPENLMACEVVYYQLLAGTTTVKIEGNRLYLTRETRPVDSSVPVTLIFEKKKV